MQLNSPLFVGRLTFPWVPFSLSSSSSSSLSSNLESYGGNRETEKEEELEQRKREERERSGGGQMLRKVHNSRFFDLDLPSVWTCTPRSAFFRLKAERNDARAYFLNSGLDSSQRAFG